MNTTNTIIPAQLEPKRKRGRPEGFVAHAARTTGLSKATIKRALRRANNICEDARHLIHKTSLDKGTYLDALIDMDLTDAEQVEQVRADLDFGHRPANAKTKIIRRDDEPEAVAAKLRYLYDADTLGAIREAL